MTALQHLAELEMKHKRGKYPNVPAFSIPRTKFSDKTANELTHAVTRCIELHGGYAVRINTQGQYNEQLGRWTKGSTRKGTADIHSILNGKHLSIEIKIGRDQLSEDQQQTAELVQRAGGYYYVARTFEGFYAWFSQQIGADRKTKGGEPI